MTHFTKSYSVPKTACDGQGRCTLAYLLDRMEDAAFEDSNRLGQGVDDLRRKYDLCWMLIQNDLTVTQLPEAGQQYTIRTAYCGVHGVSTFRSYEILVNGITVVTCIQTWVVVSYTERLLVNPKKIPELMREGFPQPQQKRHIRYGDLPLQVVASARVEQADLDFNTHMNNIRYLEHALPYLPERVLTAPFRLQLAYHHELLEGQEYDCLTGEKDNLFFVVFRSDGKDCFVLKTEPL